MPERIAPQRKGGIGLVDPISGVQGFGRIPGRFGEGKLVVGERLQLLHLLLGLVERDLEGLGPLGIARRRREHAEGRHRRQGEDDRGDEDLDQGHAVLLPAGEPDPSVEACDRHQLLKAAVRSVAPSEMVRRPGPSGFGTFRLTPT